MFGSVPSDLIDFFDFNRYAELLCDGNEVPVATPSQLDALPRAVNLSGAAENIIAMACRQRSVYTLQQLRDLVSDYHLPPGTISGTGADAHEVGISGQQLIELIADVAWCQANRRKRYAVDSPQAKDPSCDRAEERLNLLRSGERIFVMDGVQKFDGNTWTGTWYGPEVSLAGVMHGGSLSNAGLCAPRLWGCNLQRPRGRLNARNNPCCD